MSTFKRLLKLALPHKWWMLLAAFIGFLTVGSSVGLLMTSAFIIAKAALHPSVAELQVAIVGVRFFGISRGLFRYLERLVSHNVTFKLLAQFRVWFYRAIEPLAPARLQQYKSGDLLARVVSDINTLENFYIRVLAPPLVAILVSLLMWFLFSMFSIWFSFILLVFMALAGIGIPLLTLRLSRGLGNEIIQLNSELSILTVESIQGLPELLMFGQTEKHQQQVEHLNTSLVRLQQRQAVLFSLHETLIGLLMNGAVLAIFLFAVPKIQTGALDGIALAVLALGTMAAFEAVMPLPATCLYLEESIGAAERLFDITDAEPAVTPPSKPAAPLSSFDIRFDNVSFAYEPHLPVLENFSLNIPQGEHLLITGLSGVGKTTLAHLLLRFWDVNSGNITIGGHDVRNFSQQELAEIISYVPQQPFVFNGTIRENLLLTRPGATENELNQICDVVQLFDFISQLPDGLDTWIGEFGLRLSGGERQRLAIARALLKRSNILILDEPTAHIDAENARKLIHEIFQNTNCSVMVITHDPQAFLKIENVLSL